MFGGFTLVEILIVVVILSIAAAIAIPMLSNAASLQLDSAADLLAGDLEYARSMAITRQKIYTIEFDDAGNSYQLKNDTGTVIEHPVNIGSQYTVVFGSGRYDKVDMTDADFDGTNLLKFDYLGSPYGGSGNPLNSGVITLKGGNNAKHVVIEAMTGLITVTD
jgi:prepilin-type N-terminal cleavage/methylation domain-containing protein